jgi:hypothetical protein
MRQSRLKTRRPQTAYSTPGTAQIEVQAEAAGEPLVVLRRRRQVLPQRSHRKQDRGNGEPPTTGTFLDLEAYTIAEFCATHRISRSTYYVLKARSQQPDETFVLDRIIITRESAAAWRRKRTAASRRTKSRRAAALSAAE